MHKLNRLAYKNIVQLFLDIIFIIGSFFAAYYITAPLVAIKPIKYYVWILVLYIPIFVYTMSFLQMYNKTTFNYLDRILKNVLISVVVATILVITLTLCLKDAYFCKYMYLCLVLLTISTIVTERYIFYFTVRRKSISTSSTKVIIVGVQSVIDKFEYYLHKTGITMDITGYIQVSEKWPIKQKNYLGNINDLERILKNSIVDEVIFALPKEYIDEMEKYVMICEKMGVTARMVLNLYDLKVSKIYLTSIGTLPMLTFHTVCLNEYQMFIKRCVDIVGAIVGLVLTGILSIFIVPAILLTSPGPVIFSQPRVGLHGRVFKIYKFRSMYIDAEERKKELLKQNGFNGDYMFKIADDPRITKIGHFLRKSSLDELPQFINVLLGDMSLVGTRPPTLDEVNKYKLHHYRRISIKPGITGLWQVSGRSQIKDFDEVVNLDTTYIDKWSVGLDVKIMLKTLLVVFKHRGAY